MIGQADEDTGQAITAFVTLEGDLEGDDELVAEIREHVAGRIGKFARPKRIIWADDLPKTRSGKIMRRLLRDIAEGRELGDVTTLRDPDVMQQLEGKIKERRGRGLRLAANSAGDERPRAVLARVRAEGQPAAACSAPRKRAAAVGARRARRRGPRRARRRAGCGRPSAGRSA